MRRHNTAWLRACSLLAMSCGVALLGAGSPARAESPGGAGVGPLISRLADRLVPRCLSPDVGRVMQDLVDARKIQALLSSDLTLVKGKVGANQIELEVQDSAQHAYGIALAISGSRSGSPDGQGRNFLFYVDAPAGPPDPRVTQALLAVAALLDDAIPDTALVRCSGADEGGRADGRSEPHADRRYPRALALASALVQVLVIAAAIVFGLRAIPPRS
jgi:hypothetical protein